MQIHQKTFAPYLSATEIQAKVKTIAAELNALYEGQDVLLVVVLNGAFIFAADLVRHLTFQPEIQFIKVSSYGNEMVSSQKIREVGGWDNLNIQGRTVLVIEDIIDTGFTADFLREKFQQESPNSLAFVCLLFKPDAFQGIIAPEYTGFIIPSDFVVGYGLDYAQKGRELSDIWVCEG